MKVMERERLINYMDHSLILTMYCIFDAIFFYFIWKSHNDFLKILVTKIVSHWIYPKGMYMAVIHSCHFLNIYLAISCLHTFRFGFLCVMNIPLFVFSASNSKSSFKVKLKVTSYPKLSQNLLGNSFFFLIFLILC